MSDLTTSEKLIIEPTFTTPEIRFDPEAYYFFIGGNSYPENSLKFYGPVLEWVQNWSQKVVPSSKLLTIEIRLEYFNTSTAKVLLDLLRLFEALHERGQAMQIRWLYLQEDTEMEDAGLDYQAAVKVPFELVAIDE
ncbi:MAG: DUF1987 domain-containing protein [Bacteroidia bacterium]|nr:DUF1987 domain-containing protein [Bacteroidia bacterium]MCX7652777.1 DUF1987 domain-containing protein [Bacteroidia bacterium]MDW8417390.1 DUF1987 domain-containing protein [Bacteroidia bacterium]